MIPKSLCVTRSCSNLFLKRITQRPKYLHLNEIIELTPFRVSTSSVSFDMRFKTDTPNVNEREGIPRVVVMVFKVQFNRDLVRDDKGYEFISKGDAVVDSFKRCCTFDAFDVGYRVRILHRSSINNSASLSNKFRRFYFILKFGIPSLLHHVVTAIADRLGGWDLVRDAKGDEFIEGQLDEISISYQQESSAKSTSLNNDAPLSIAVVERPPSLVSHVVSHLMILSAEFTTFLKKTTATFLCCPWPRLMRWYKYEERLRKEDEVRSLAI
nr:hypothetical protein [Tanacetum cinerariifolium]